MGTESSHSLVERLSLFDWMFGCWLEWSDYWLRSFLSVQISSLSLNLCYWPALSNSEERSN